MKKVVHFEVHFVILYSKTELLRFLAHNFFYLHRRYGVEGKINRPYERKSQSTLSGLAFIFISKGALTHLKKCRTKTKTHM